MIARAAARANDSAVSSEVEQCREEDRLRTNRHASVLFGTDLQKMDDLIYFALNILRIEKIAEHVDAGEPLRLIHAHHLHYCPTKDLESRPSLCPILPISQTTLIRTDRFAPAITAIPARCREKRCR